MKKTMIAVLFLLAAPACTNKKTNNSPVQTPEPQPQPMKIVFPADDEGFLFRMTDYGKRAEAQKISNTVENPDDELSLRFETTAGWSCTPDEAAKSVSIAIADAEELPVFKLDGKLTAYIMNGSEVVSQSNYDIAYDFSLCALPASFVEITPQVLEAIGGKVPVTINLTFPRGWFDANTVMTITPVLYYGEMGESWGASATFQGEDVTGNEIDFQVISQEKGATVTLKTKFIYKPEMKKSELFLHFDAKRGDETVRIPEVKIGEGVIA